MVGFNHNEVRIVIGSHRMDIYDTDSEEVVKEIIAWISKKITGLEGNGVK